MTDEEELRGKGVKALPYERVPLDSMLTYAGERADLTFQLGPRLSKTMTAAGLEVLLSLEFQVPLVVTLPRNPADPPGYRSLAEVARARGIPVATPPDASGRATLDWIRAVRPDVIYSFQYAHHIPRTIRGVARRRFDFPRRCVAIGSALLSWLGFARLGRNRRGRVPH